MACMQGRGSLARYTAANQQLEQQLAHEVAWRQELQVALAAVRVDAQTERATSVQLRQEVEVVNSQLQQQRGETQTACATNGQLRREMEVVRSQLQQEQQQKAEVQYSADQMARQVEQLGAQLERVRSDGLLASAAADEAAKVCICVSIVLCASGLLMF